MIQPVRKPIDMEQELYQVEKSLKDDTYNAYKVNHPELYYGHGLINNGFRVWNRHGDRYLVIWLHAENKQHAIMRASEIYKLYEEPEPMEGEVES